jgi:hypothetical protein
MDSIPKHISGAKVIQFTPVDERHTHTGECRQFRNNELLGPAKWLAICQYEDDGGFYLFSGIPKGQEEFITDTLHDTIEEAIEQAEFEYTGTTNTWMTP